MDEGGVNDAFRAAAPRLRLSEIFEAPRCASAPAAASNWRPHPSAERPSHLMARAEELLNDGRPDEPCGAGDEDPHGLVPLVYPNNIQTEFSGFRLSLEESHATISFIDPLFDQLTIVIAHHAAKYDAGQKLNWIIEFPTSHIRSEDPVLSFVGPSVLISSGLSSPSSLWNLRPKEPA